jgi:hypothetical protein
VTTYGGTGVYAAQIGGVWDALLGEGRNFWFFANSDWHTRDDPTNAINFDPEDRRSMNDFYPGEYQRVYTRVDRRAAGSRRDGVLNPQQVVNALRSGNTFVAMGQLIDRLAFIACAGQTRSYVERLAIEAALDNVDVVRRGCATMGEKLVVAPGANVAVAIVVRDPSGTNASPYTFNNPSLAQQPTPNIQQPLNAPVLHHVDVIKGNVTGYRTPGTPEYSGAWPANWNTDPRLDRVPAGAKNTTAALFSRFDNATWVTLPRAPEFKVMSFSISNVTQSQYLRLRGTNLPPGVPYETDPNGNPLSDVSTNVSGPSIRCLTTGSNVPENNILYTGAAIDGCPNHLFTQGGVKYSSYDVAAWADLWFYSNPIFIEVK